MRIGFLGGLTGSVAELGVQGRNGALLAIAALDEAVPDGPRHELVALDDHQDPATVRAAVDTLARERVAFAVGPMTSAMAVAAVPEAQRVGLVLVSPTATTDELSGRPDVFFRVAADATYGARQLADAALAQGGKRFALLLDMRNRSYSASFGNAFAARVRERGAAVTATVEIAGADNDFRELADRLLADRPDSALVVAGVGDSALAAQQLRQRAPAIRLAITPWAANARYVELGGRLVEGTLVQQALDLETTRAPFVGFRQRYHERFGEDPATPAVQAYEAVMLGAAALAEVTPSRSLQQVLSQPGRRWPGLYSDIVLDANGDTQRPLRLAQVHDGRFVGITP